MFDIGWTELLLIGVVTILVVGPKELPGMLRTLGQMVRKVRQMSSEFRAQFDEAIQAEEIIDDIKKNNPMKDLKDDITNQFDTDINSYYENDKEVNGSSSQSETNPNASSQQSTSNGGHKDDKVVELQPEQSAQSKIPSDTINNDKAKEA